MRFLDWLPVLSLLAAGTIALPRAWSLRVSGRQVIVADRQRTAAELVSDTLLLVALCAWGYLVFARTGWLPMPALPSWLDSITPPHIGLSIIGSLLLVAWVAIYGFAVHALGDSWRLGIDRDRPGLLVTKGIYRWSRNPIYLAFDILFLGTFFVDGRLVFLIMAVVLATLLHGIIRREEHFLAAEFGDAYRAYCAGAARYASCPWV